MFLGLKTLNHQKKRLDDEVVLSFFEAADERRRTKKPRNRDELIESIKKKNSYRWWRLQHDYKWLQKEMRKAGYNPEEARELL
jgi:hypothetical protein